MSEIINLDHQASTPLAPGVLDAMLPHFQGDSPNPHSAHLLGVRAQQAIENARNNIAQLLGADCPEIYFTSGATEANNLALSGVIQHLPKGSLITSKIEHKCVLATARHLEAIGHSVTYIGVDSVGYVDLNELECALAEKQTSLVSIMMANNEIGTVQNLRKVSEICHKHKALLHSDMAQCITHTNLNLNELGVDMASFSAHKMNGPKGIGVLYVNNDIRDLIKPIIHGGGQEMGMRSGTLPTALCVGFGEAAKYWSRNGENIRKHVLEVRNHLWGELEKSIAKIRLIGPNLQDRHVSNLNIHIPGIDADMLLSMMYKELAASTGSACTSGLLEPSHVLHALSEIQALEDGSIRLSCGEGNSLEQVTNIAKSLSSHISLLKD